MTKFKQILLFFTLCVAMSGSYAAPRLNFSDLISGPSVGLNDGKGSGVVVTIWGQKLGADQKSSTITFTDSDGKTSAPAHIYYWKNADGTLPGGPANLFASHAMQEIAFSIPNVASGEGTIRVKVNGEISNALPFTIRDGAIYHVKPSGNDSSGTGTFSKPWKTINKAFNAVSNPGSTIYVHDSLATTDYSKKEGAAFWDNAPASSGLTNQYGVIAFPSSQPSVTGLSGFRNYRTAGQVISKFSVFASECDEGADHRPKNCDPVAKDVSIAIQGSAFGRTIGNTVTDRPGGCADGPQGGINGSALGRDRVSAYQVLGNEIYDYGCEGGSKFRHTTYMTIRSGDTNLQVPPWRMGWNYLHDNHAKNGFNMFDENFKGEQCGSPNDTVIVNDNVVINQAGVGINIQANCPWTNDFDIYNNILLNVGLANEWDAVDPLTSVGPATSAITINDNKLMGTVNIFNNTIIGWNGHSLDETVKGCLGLKGSGDNVDINWNNNVCITPKDDPFVGSGCCGASVQLDNVSGSNNVWYYSGTASPKLAIKPTWDNFGITNDPLVILTPSSGGGQLKVGSNSPLIGKSDGYVSYDIYGNARQSDGEIGAVEFFTSRKPKSPTGVTGTVK